LTSSFNTYTQSASSGVSASINAATQSLSSSVADINASQLSTASFNVFTQSINTNISQINARVSSSATTGSNTFIGNQIVSGNVNIAGNITAESASFLYLRTIYETASIIFSSGSNQLGDELIDVQTLSGSVKVQGDLTVNGVPVQTSSFDASGYLLTSSFNTYTQSAASGVSASINTATQSLSSSIAVTTNNLDLEVNQKLDTGSFNTYTQSNDIKVNALIAATGSYAISSSVANTFDAFSSSISLTYATLTELSSSASILQNGINSKVENSTFNTYTSSQASVNQTLINGISIRLTTASFNTYTSSNDSKVNSLIAATGSYITSAQTSSMTVLSSSFAQTASFALNVTPTDVTPFLSKSIFDAYTGSAALGVSESINSATQSLSSSIAVTTNNLDLEVNGKLDSSSFNTYTQSNDSKVNSLISATGSYITSAQTSSMSVLSSSFAVTASYAENVTPTDVSMFVSQSTFNAYTQSNNSVVNALVSATSSYAISSSVAAIDASQDGRINSLTAQTSSYVTESETGSFATTGSNTFIGNQTISGNLDVTGKITALSASITYLETIFQTSSVLFSSGSNILGDEASDTQTLFGKVDIKTGPLVITGSTFVSGNITMVNGTDLVTHHVKAPGVNGVEIQTNTGGVVALFGAGGGLGSTFYGQINATSISASGNITGNLLGTASFATKALTASFAENVTPTDVSMFVSQSTFNTYTSSINSYTASNDSKVNSLIAATASYVTSAQTSSMSVLSSSYAVTASFALNATADRSGLITTGSGATTQAITGSLIISGNLVVSGANINLEVDPPALGSPGTTNIKTLLDSTASAIITSVDVTRQAAGPTGDLTGVRLQTFSGSSDTSGDRLLSRVNTGVNRNTSTGLAGSVVNTQINAVWATGSTTFTSQLISTAQSGSATLFLNAGNAASNYAGGTASLQAARVNIGATNGVINSTGSFGPIVIAGPLNQPAFSLRSGSFEVTTPQGSGSFYTNLPITSSAGRINGDLFVLTNITASVISASTYIGVLSATSSSFSAFAVSSSQAESSSFATNSTLAQTASFVLGLAPQVATLGYATTGSNIFNGNQTITGSLFVSSAIGDSTIRGGLLIYGDNAGAALTIYSGSVAINTEQGQGFFYSNVPITSSHARFNGQSYIKRLNIEDNSGNASLQVENNVSITGSLNVGTDIIGTAFNKFATTGSNIFKGIQIISSSVRGEQYVGSVASNTASFDCSTGNFFTLVLNAGTNHISASNIRPGQTINVKVTTQTGNAVTCSSAIKQPSGSLYTPTNGAGTDILTFISYDTTLFMVATKTFI
jgi:hypothetical protein